MSPDQLRQIFRRILSRVSADALPIAPPSEEPGELPTLCDGRHPAGIMRADFSELHGAGGYLARMAHFEAASVSAFTHLAEELDDLQAPLEYVERAKKAAREEVVHAHAVSALARKRGAVAPSPRLKPPPLRTLEEVATENAAEGCVREAFGALVGLYQSVHATAPDVRATMQLVADDEVSHAALSLELHHHFTSRLDGEARLRVEATRDRAMGEILRQAFAFEDAPWRDELGLPNADVLFDLAREFKLALADA
ncbi:MAG: hypothetical protein JNK82_04115 [Myxococcaceae bacterium]|nr:hypothetical protein [Myxococcaceae bacterium]